YTGTQEFRDAAHARQTMRKWVGNNNKFYPHAAQYEFEAWLLPYWSDIQALAGHNRSAPAGEPELVNQMQPPSARISEIFRLGNKRNYVKPRDAQRILANKDLLVAADACPELKAFLNTILALCGGDRI
ncbi:MAG: DUF4276 family protein, partial [Bryobacteraceae bacterium]